MTVRELVVERSGGLCEAHGFSTYCSGHGAHLHHRKLRRHHDERPEALLWVCHHCHRAIHDRVGEAYAAGLLVHSYDDPAGTPVDVRGRQTVAAPEPGSVCPACDRRVPVPHEDKTLRPKRTVSIAVPKDAEDGAEVLRTLISECRKRLAAQLAYDADVPPYFVLAAVLSDWLAGGN